MQNFQFPDLRPDFGFGHFNFTSGLVLVHMSFILDAFRLPDEGYQLFFFHVMNCPLMGKPLRHFPQLFHGHFVQVFFVVFFLFVSFFRHRL